MTDGMNDAEAVSAASQLVKQYGEDAEVIGERHDDLALQDEDILEQVECPVHDDGRFIGVPARPGGGHR